MKYLDKYLFFDEKKISEKPVFIEVGSFSGNHGKKIKDEYPNSKVLIYEGSDKNFEELKNNIKDYDIEIINKVISSKADKIILYEYNYKSSNSIFDRSSNNKKILNKCIKDSITVDDIFKENNLSLVDVLFLNCEGSELEIIDYILNSKELQKKINQISVSFHPQIYGQEKMQTFINKIKKTHKCIYDNGKYHNYLIFI